MAQKQKLVIVESSVKAQAIGRFLGKGYKVLPSNGHIRDLPKSSLGIDVENDFEPRYITIRGCGEVVEKLKREAKNAQTIYLATDPDREGEAISWHLAQLLKIDDETACRIEFNEVTQQAVKNAIKSPRKINKNLFNAQQARRVLDRLVGYQISPLLWAKVKKGLSAGRVQSVAARLIDDREKEVTGFDPREYWSIEATLAQQKGKVPFRAAYETKDRFELGTKQDVDAILAAVENASFVVQAVSAPVTRQRFAPAPFTTSVLQQEASRKLNFTTKRTMTLAQQLYEGIEIPGRGTVGLVSYIRTDSVRLSSEAVEAARQYILANFGAEALPETPNIYKSRKQAQDAHEAIRPTTLLLHPDEIVGALTRDQYRLYKLIFNRFVACQMKPAVYQTQVYTIKAGTIPFRSVFTKLIETGFTAVYVEDKDEGEDDEHKVTQKVPDLVEGEVLRVEDIASEQHFTQPPPRYTEASLVRALEERGIGRPSTYSPIISTIIDRGYVLREKRTLYPTELGTIVTGIMKEYFDEIVDVEFTANIENRLDNVESGELNWRSVLRDFYTGFAQELATASEMMEKIEIADEVSDVQCEKCGAMMVYKMGRFGKFLACPNFPECRNTKTITQDTGIACPKCGSRILRRKSRRGREFYGCERYPECDFVSWERPVPDKCPECGGLMVVKSMRRDIMTLRCINPECAHEITKENVVSEEA